ncbi:MAG: AMP-binding protein, partial [Acidobacteria bacterium]|nr:AMP-binding protein [Acidobacteriota bacterium]
MTKTFNIASHLVEMARRQPEATAIIVPWGRHGGSLTYQQLDDRSSRIARGMEMAGIGRGVRAALMVQPGLDLFALAFALFKCGAIPVLIDPGIGIKNMKSCLERARPQAFIGITKAHVARVVLGWGKASVSNLITVGPRLFWGGRTLNQIEQLGADGPRESITPISASEEEAAVVFTSGSTGPPKGVVYRHGNFSAQIDALREVYGFSPGEVNLPTFPLFALFDPALGMTTVIPDMDPTHPARANPEKIIEPIKEYGVTTMFGSPALLDTVGRWGAANGVKLPTMRRVISAGAPVAPRVIERFTSMMDEGGQIFTPYGATESLPVASIGSDEILSETRHDSDRGRGTCVGLPVPSAEVRVIRTIDEPIERWDESLCVDPGVIGEIVVKGPQVTLDYFEAPEHTKKGKVHDGEAIRHRMGDLGYFDDRGRLWFCGRKAHRVVAADRTYYTVPCEGVFNAHPGVFRTALVGIIRGEQVEPVLIVELDRDGGRPNVEVVEKELLELGSRHEHTAPISEILFHKAFPVDIRHNAKINRALLASW